jgi:hypothetical protein
MGERPREDRSDMAVSLGVIYGRKRSSERRAKEGEVERKVGGGKKLYLHAACQVTSPRGLSQGRVAGDHASRIG